MERIRSALVDQALNWMRSSGDEDAAAPVQPRRGAVKAQQTCDATPNADALHRCAVLDLAPDSPCGAELAALLEGCADCELAFVGQHAQFTTAVATATAVVVACDVPGELVARIAGWRVAHPEVVVIVALRSADPGVLRSLFAAGIGDFVVAPFDAVQLRARIDAAIARMSTGTELQGGDWPLMIGAATLGDESFRQFKSRIVAAFERGYIEGLLRRSMGNISQSARLAHKNRRAFFELIRKHGIDATEFRQPEADSVLSPRQIRA